MGKLNVVMLRYLSKEHFRVLTAVSGGRRAAGGEVSSPWQGRAGCPPGTLPTGGVREGAFRAGRTAPSPDSGTAAGRLPFCGWRSTSLESPV